MSTRSKNKAPSKEALRKAGGEYARKNVEQVFERSNLDDKTGDFPRFALEEVHLGRVLGKGGFGTVNEINGFTVSSLSVARSGRRNKAASLLLLSQDPVADFENRAFIADHCIRKGGDARYAIKYLSPKVIQEPALYIQGITDMAVETRFLSAIEHPNIVKMRATSSEPFTEKYFIVMDRLYDTLEKRLVSWESRNKRISGMCSCRSDPTKEQAFLIERLMAAYDLTDALLYLHNKGILYRDLKPDNIGFDIRDDVKIFDFGLSKEITDSIEKGPNGTYHLTGETGTYRYMAPEVALGETYNAKCDVYSMSVLLWQMLALTKPYLNYTTLQSFRDKIFRNNRRPALDPTWSKDIHLLLQRGWDRELQSRHEMKSFSSSLRTILLRLREGDDTGMEHSRRRSTFVYRKSSSKDKAADPPSTEQKEPESSQTLEASE